MPFETARIFTVEEAVEKMKHLPYEITTPYGNAELYMVPADLEGFENYVADISPRFMMANDIWAQQDSKDRKVKLAYLCLTDDEGIYSEFIN